MTDREPPPAPVTDAIPPRWGWFGRMAHARRAPLAMFFASMLESTFVPVPIEMLMTPLMIADRRRTFVFATAVFLGCLAGSLIMYGVGCLAYQTVGVLIIETFGFGGAEVSFREAADTHGVFALAVVAITPIPLIVGSIGAGAAGMNVAMFLLVLGGTRAIRYYGIALAVHFLGPKAEMLLTRYQESARVRAATWGGTIVLAVGFAIVVFAVLPNGEP